MISSLIAGNKSLTLNIKEKDVATEQREKFVIFKNTLEIITRIKEGDKLSKTDIYYIDEIGMVQKIKRWWWNQNRKKTFDDLNSDFTKFADFLDKLLMNFKPVNKKYIALCKEIILFINDLMIGLYNLKTTYPDYKEIRCKIDSIILTLIDFKENYVETKRIKNSNSEISQRRNSFDL
jgi:hypothetical protein|uniref:Uncharacterized protein n=1 Tax=viral metagenome TaxID=1070528 RepID=A0A6C0BZC0_9ZZZZ